MRTLTIALALSPLLVAGCGRPADVLEAGFTVQAVGKDGLVLVMSVPERHYATGDVVPVKLLARNEGKKDLVIRADSGALVTITLSRFTGTGWEEVKRFPATAVMVVRSWKLPAHGSHTFRMDLEVTPDWPTGEWVKLSGTLNGRPEVVAEGLIQIHPTKAQRDRAKVD